MVKLTNKQGYPNKGCNNLTDSLVQGAGLGLMDSLAIGRVRDPFFIKKGTLIPCG